jgi:lipoprotein LprG
MRIQAFVLLVCLGFAAAACGGEDLGGDKLPTDAAGLQAASADAMGAVTSVRFELERTGAPVFIDQVESISLDSLEGRFQAPGSADALLRVTVNGSLGTKLGAVAIGEEVWLSNPVTGTFENLPPGFDIDPSLFFDPKDGWQPLIEALTETEFVEEADRNGTTYRLRATAPAANMQSITAGLVRGQDVELDLWIHPVTAAVRAIEFSTVFDGATSDWVLELSEYGEQFEIVAPDQ